MELVTTTDHQDRYRDLEIHSYPGSPESIEGSSASATTMMMTEPNNNAHTRMRSRTNSTSFFPFEQEDSITERRGFAMVSPSHFPATSSFMRGHDGIDVNNDNDTDDHDETNAGNAIIDSHNHTDNVNNINANRWRSGSTFSNFTLASSSSSAGGWSVPSLVGSPLSDRAGGKGKESYRERERASSVDMVLGTPGSPACGWDTSTPEPGSGSGSAWIAGAQEGRGEGKGKGTGKGKGKEREDVLVVGMDVGVPGQSWTEETEGTMAGGLGIEMTNGLRSDRSQRSGPVAPVLLGPVLRRATPDLPSRATTPMPTSAVMRSSTPATAPLANSNLNGTAPQAPRKDLPQWLKNRPRSSSSASLASKFSLTSSASMTSLSSKISNARTKIKSKIKDGKRDQADREVPIPGSGSGPVDGGNVKKEPKGMMRRLMIRSKTTPVLAKTVTQAGSGPDMQRTKLDDAHARGTIVSPRRSPMSLGDVFASSPSEARKPRVSASREEELETGEPGRGFEGDAMEGSDLTSHTAHQEYVLPDISSFQEKLPREIRLMVLQAIVDLHIDDHDRDVQQGRWKGELARKRWYGETAGRRELLRLRRVCVDWNDLVLDGQMWSDCHMSPYLDHMPPSTLIKILRSASSCIRELDVSGWRNIPGELLITAMQAGGAFDTGLRKLDLQGCREMKARELQWLLEHSPNLTWLSLKGLSCARREHISAVAACTQLEYLDLAFCEALPWDCYDMLLAKERPCMRELRMSGFRGIINLAMVAVHMPNLQTLDLSYSFDLADKHIKTLVTPDAQEWLPAFVKSQSARHRKDSISYGGNMKFLTTDEAGQPGSDFTGCNGLVPRWVLKLRKLVLSQCRQLTDKSCQYLAHAVPALEIFEMANADGNANIQTAGLIDLFSTCPAIRKIDLEGAIDIEDDLVPALLHNNKAAPGSPSTVAGSQLDTVCLAFAGNLSSAAMHALVLKCTRLKFLDIDNTMAGDLLVKEFIRKRGRGTVLSVIDCRGVSRNVVEAFENRRRARNGWRGWQAAPLRYEDGPSMEGRPDECSDAPVIQSFWTWNRVPRADRPMSMALDRERSRFSDYDADDLPDTPNSCILM